MRPRTAAVKKSLKARIRRAQGGRCLDCGGAGTGLSGYNPLEPHHLIPVCRGGQTLAENLVILCRTCHVRRHQAAEGRAA